MPISLRKDGVSYMMDRMPPVAGARQTASDATLADALRNLCTRWESMQGSASALASDGDLDEERYGRADAAAHAYAQCIVDVERVLRTFGAVVV